MKYCMSIPRIVLQVTVLHVCRYGAKTPLALQFILYVYILVQTGNEYLENVTMFERREPLNISRLIEGAGFCHDATWTLAKALNNTINGLLQCLYTF